MSTNTWRRVAGCLALVLATIVGLPTASGDQPPAGDPEQEIEPATIELGRPADFTRDIYPILERNCVACHNVSEREGDFVAENVTSILAGGDSGPAAVAEKPEESLLYLYATRVEEPHMPPIPNQVGARALTAQEAGLLRQWILEGAKVGSKSQRPAPIWQPVPPQIKSIHCVALSPWNRFVIWGRANQIYVYDLLTGREPQRLVDPNLVAVNHAGRPMYPSGAAHRDLVQSLALSPDGTLLASGGYRVVKFWQRPPNARRSEMSLPRGVSALAVSDDGHWLAAGTSENQIDLWDLQAGKPVATLTGHTSAVSALQFTSSSDRLFSSSQDKTIRSWKAPSGEFLGHIQTDSRISSLAINRDADRLVSAHADHGIRVWDVSVAGSTVAPAENESDRALPEPLLQIVGHTKPVTSVSFLLRDNMQIVSGSDDGTVRVWDMNDGQQLLSINYGGPVRAVAVRGDNQAIAAAGPDNVARVWDCSGKQLAEFRGTLSRRRQVRRLREEQVVAGQRVDHANSTLNKVKGEFDALETLLKKVRDDKNKAGAALDEAKTKAQMATDLLTSAKEELAKNETDPALQQKVAEAEAEAKKSAAAVAAAHVAHQAAQQAADIAEDSAQKVQQSLQHARSRLSSLQRQKKVTEEQLQTALADDAKTATRPLAIAYSRDGSQLAVGMDHLVHLFDAASGEPVESFAGHEGPVTALVFGRDDSLVTGAADQRAIIWDLHPSWQLVGQLGVSPDNPLDTSASPFTSRVLALDFSRDGRFLATGGGEPSRSGELMLWDVASRSRMREIVDAHSDTILGVEFSRDNAYLLSGAADKFVKIFNVETGQEVRSFEGHTHHVLDVSWKADGNTIVSAGADNVVKYWNIDTGQQIQTIGGYAKQVTSVQFPGTGDDIVSCSGDKSVRFHSASNGNNYRNFGGGTDYMYSVAASRDLAIVVAGGEDGVLRVWHGKDGSVHKTLDPPQP